MNRKAIIDENAAAVQTGNHVRFIDFRTSAVSDLERGIAAGELVLHYQPRVSLYDQRISGFEALVRWKHPRRGLLDPAHFIVIAEESSLIVPLGKWVLDEACRQMALWQPTLRPAHLLTISVNTSIKQLMQPLFVNDVCRILAETGLRPERLRLEIAERSIISNGEAAIVTLRRLAAMGIGLEVDDFGTGHSSCNYLRALPFDTLKIDKSFVNELGKRNDSSGIINSILRATGSLGIEVTAEGVEARHQLDRLTTLGCRHGQGYYFSRPLDAAGTKNLIDKDQTLDCSSFTEIGGMPTIW